MKVPICQIHMALSGHIEYLEKTAVFRGGPPPVEKTVEKKPDIAEKVARILGGKSE